MVVEEKNVLGATVRIHDDDIITDEKEIQRRINVCKDINRPYVYKDRKEEGSA